MSRVKEEYYYIKVKDRTDAHHVCRSIQKRFSIPEFFTNPEENSVDYVLTDYKKFISFISHDTLEYLKDSYKNIEYLPADYLHNKDIGEL